MKEVKFKMFVEYKNLDCGYPDYSLMLNVHSIDFVKGTLKAGNLNETYKIKDVKLLEYTGLKDKNGIEIYEGDIVKANGYIYEVIYWKEEAKYHLTSDYYDSDCSFGDVCNAFIKGNNGEYKDLEVIGNIYKNPELLEESTNE